MFRPGTQPLLVSIPHMGTYVPPAIADRFTEEARRVPDTDWRLDRLYDFAQELGCSVLQATYSRYVVDLNRPPDNASLYPGQATTSLCPDLTFDGTPVYLDGQAVSDEEMATRREAWWRPYHEQLRHELDRIRGEHGVAMLWDAHSIRSVLPHFFEGKLPDLNIGTAKGASCAPQVAGRLWNIAAAVPGHTSVLNGRYTGGYITRHYGRPDEGFHAVQLEMTQCSYMEERWPFDYMPAKAADVQPHLRQMLQAMIDFACSQVHRQ